MLRFRRVLPHLTFEGCPFRQTVKRKCFQLCIAPTTQLLNLDLQRAQPRRQHVLDITGCYIDGTLNAIDTTQWYPTVMRKDYMVGLTVSENGLDDPDQQFYENFVCGAERNYTGYCSPEVDKLVDQQSMQTDNAKRKQIVWEIERKLAEDAARPAIFYPVSAACWQPQFKGHTMMVNGNYNGWRLEDAWLDN